MPSIEYLFNDLVIPEKTCNNLMAKISSTFKHKVGLASTAPNNMIFNKLEYGIQHIFERQVQLHATNWITRINNNNISGEIARHRLQCLQNTAWSTNNFLNNPYKIINHNGTNITHDILWLLRQQGFSFSCRNTLDTPICINKIDDTIEQLMNQTFFHKVRKNLAKNNLLFIGQLLNESRTKTLNWNQMIKPNQKGKKGKTPNWFLQIKLKLDLHLNNNPSTITNFNTQNIFHQYTYISESSKTKKHWIATTEQNQIIIGKKKNNSSANKTVYTHYKRIFNSSPLEACKGCIINTNPVPNSNCLFARELHQAIQIPVVSSTISNTSFLPITGTWDRLKMSPGSLQTYLNNKISETNPPTEYYPTILINYEQEIFNTLENTFLTDLEIIYQLAHIANQIKTNHTFSAYTDGSLSQFRNTKYMGFGWTLQGSNNQQYTFQGQTNNFPSSTRAEITAILTLIVIIPDNSSITIFTDSQAALQAINKSFHISPSQGLRKYKNWPLLDKIIETCHNRNIHLTLEKVLAHAGIPGNEKADLLAKVDPLSGMQPGEKLLSLNNTNNHRSRITTKWNNIDIDIPIKNFSQTLFKAKRLAHWRLLNRNREWLNNPIIEAIDWKLTFECLHPSSINHGFTSKIDHSLRKFSLSLWNNELPTKTKLHTRSPQIYHNNLCFKCGCIETPIHPFECQNILPKIRQQYYKIIFDSTKNKILPKFKHHFQNLIFNSTSIQYTHKFREIIKGAIHKDLKELLYKCINDKTTAKNCIHTISNNFKLILFDIWKTRCNSFIEWEKQNNINTKLKKQHKFSSKNKDIIAKIHENYIKDQFVDVVNTFMGQYIKGSTQIFSLLKFNYSTSVALAR
jgi:ribonuclease HI